MKPEGETPDLDGGEERGAVLGVSCGDATPPFEHQEGIFDQVAQFVEVFVGRSLVFSVFRWRDDGVHAHTSRMLKNGIRIIALVRNQMTRVDPLN
jgi:hypothetical protein